MNSLTRRFLTLCEERVKEVGRKDPNWERVQQIDNLLESLEISLGFVEDDYPKESGIRGIANKAGRIAIEESRYQNHDRSRAAWLPKK